MDIPYGIDWISRNVCNIRCDFHKKESYEFLLTSDAHWDNAHSDQEMFKRHLGEAVERGAGIIDNGDLLCLMQGKWDPRSDQTHLRSEHCGNDYLDRVVDTATGFLAPYAGNLVALGHGNHETSVINRHGYDATANLCKALRKEHGSPVKPHWYSGWILFRCRRGEDGQGQTIRLFRHHGTGSGAPVTRGVIQTNRIAVQYPDADVVLTGHTHDDWIVSVPRMRITERGRIHHDEQLHVRVPGYKDAIGDGAEGWETVKGHNIKSKGAVWLTIRQSHTGNRRWSVETRRAK